MVGCSRSIVDGTLKPLKSLSFDAASTVLEGHAVILKCLVYGLNYIGEPTAVLFKKSRAKRGFSSRYKQLIDLDMWFHILESGKFGYLHEELCSIRMHEGQQTKVNIGQLVHLEEPFFLLEDHLSKETVRATGALREFITYSTVYRLWKEARRNQVPFSLAVRTISRRYGMLRMICLYPFYKFYKWYLAAARTWS